MARSDCFVSVVAPVCNDAAIVEAFITDVMAVLRDSYANYELVLVDDGSEDDTVNKISMLLKRYECIRLIRLSRNFGEALAISAGMNSVIGDFVVVMLPDSDPPALIPRMVQQVRDGAGVIFGIRKDRLRESFLMRTGAALFYWYCRRVLKLKLPKNSVPFRALSRQAVNAILQIKDRCRDLRLLSAHVGYENQGFVYEPLNRRAKPRTKGLVEALNLAFDMIVSTSSHPLRFVSWFGVVASILNIAYSGYVIAIYLFKKQVAQGWTTLSLQTAAMFFFVFLILIVLSEYIGHILAETSGRPMYYLLEERNSSVLIADQERKNVVNDSLDVAAAEGAVDDWQWIGTGSK